MGYCSSVSRSSFVCVVLAVVLAGSFGCRLQTREAPEEAGATQGARAPEFELQDSEGASVSLDGLLDGNKAAVVMFYRGHW